MNETKESASNKQSAKTKEVSMPDGRQVRFAQNDF